MSGFRKFATPLQEWSAPAGHSFPQQESLLFGPWSGLLSGFSEIWLLLINTVAT